MISNQALAGASMPMGGPPDEFQELGDLQAGVGQAGHAQRRHGGHAGHAGPDQELAAGDAPLLLVCAGWLAHSPPSCAAISAARATARLMRT